MFRLKTTPLLILSIAAVLSGVPILAGLAQADDVYVQLRTSVVRAQPEFYASAVKTVAYGDKLSATSSDGGWVKVSLDGGKSGYLPLSAVTNKVVLLSAKSAKKVGADANEVVLAGKGFSKEVEAQFKASDSNLRYDYVSRMEKEAVASDSEVVQFAKSGQLRK